MSSDSETLIDKLARGCFKLLLAAGALYLAVHLFLSVEVTLLVIAGVIVLASGLFTLWRHHHDGW